MLSWTFGEWMFKGKPSMLGAASGAVAGLVAITPAAGNVGIPGAFVIGLAAGVVCLWGVNGLKQMLGADDSLDVFGVHAVGGILGALLTGVFVSPDLGGPGFVSDWVTGKTELSRLSSAQLWIQAKAVGITIVWSGVVAFIAYKIVDMIVGLRVTEEEEREGLDITLARRIGLSDVEGSNPRCTSAPGIPGGSPQWLFGRPRGARFLRGLPAERDADHRAVEVEAFHLLARLEVVVEIAPACEDIAPPERVTDAGEALAR